MSLQALEFDLPILPGSMPPVLHMSQYDSGRQWTAYLTSGDSAYSPGSGSTAKIKGVNPAGVPWELEATVSNNTVTFTPEGTATDQFGVMPVTIEIVKSGEKITPLCVIFDIQKAGYTNEEMVRSPEFQTAVAEAVSAYAPLMVTITKNGSTYSSDTPYATIAAAEAEARPIFVNYNNAGAHYRAYFFSDEGGGATFVGIDMGGGSYAHFQISVNSNGTVYVNGI